jgi:ribosome maturation factor RimP
MLNKEHITKLANEALEGSDNYLIEVKVSSRNKITVLIENDQNVAIKDCVKVSRHIESSLDREKDDFELEVSSPGIDQPLKHKRQYKKNIGRELEVRLTDESILTGMLLEANLEKIKIKPEKKKKEKLMPEPLEIALENIKESKLIIKI